MKWRVRAFSRTDGFAWQRAIPEIDPADLRVILGLPSDYPMLLEYDLDDRAAQLLQPYLSFEFDPENFHYGVGPDVGYSIPPDSDPDKYYAGMDD